MAASDDELARMLGAAAAPRPRPRGGAAVAALASGAPDPRKASTGDSDARWDGRRTPVSVQGTNQIRWAVPTPLLNALKLRAAKEGTSGVAEGIRILTEQLAPELEAIGCTVDWL